MGSHYHVTKEIEILKLEYSYPTQRHIRTSCNTSSFVLAEISARSPRKLLYITKKIFSGSRYATTTTTMKMKTEALCNTLMH